MENLPTSPNSETHHPGPIRVLIVDDYRLIRELWRALLTADPRFAVVGDCGTGEEGVHLAGALQPHIVLMDLELPGISGYDATEQILKHHPHIKILALSSHTQPVYVRRMMQKGAMGYVTKLSNKKELFEALLEVSGGNQYICTGIKETLAQQFFTDSGKVGIDALSKKELQVIEYIKRGHTSTEIGHFLKLSANTVQKHRQRILKKLNIKNTTALINLMHQ